MFTLIIYAITILVTVSVLIYKDHKKSKAKKAAGYIPDDYDTPIDYDADQPSEKLKELKTNTKPSRLISCYISAPSSS